jgi:hypothetical protein
MVKGVSKTIIEVNNTGSRLFEKIVFYVTPEYGNLSAKQLKKAASAFTFQYNGNLKPASLRKRYRTKRIVTAIAITGAIISVGIVVLALIL